jgi:hypothetical protein
MLKISIGSIVALVLCAGCAGTKISKEIPMESGNYLMRIKGSEPQQVFINIVDDSVALYQTVDGKRFGAPVSLPDNSLLTERSFDFDVLTVPFKYRPSASSFPRQLTADFNGNIFLGYRSDRFRTRYISTPAGQLREIKERAFTVGAFGGIGTTFVSPWTTNYQTTDEYNGFILGHGFSAMTGIKNLTVGVGVGWDYLTDRDRDIWIYQNKPWYGVTVSLNLN